MATSLKLRMFPGLVAQRSERGTHNRKTMNVVLNGETAGHVLPGHSVVLEIPRCGIGPVPAVRHLRSSPWSRNPNRPLNSVGTVDMILGQFSFKTKTKMLGRCLRSMQLPSGCSSEDTVVAGSLAGWRWPRSSGRRLRSCRRGRGRTGRSGDGVRRGPWPCRHRPEGASTWSTPDRATGATGRPNRH